MTVARSFTIPSDVYRCYQGTLSRRRPFGAVIISLSSFPVIIISSYHPEMPVLQGTPEDAAAVMEIVTACVAQMRAAGSDQWSEVYPNREVIDADAESGGLFVFRDGGRVAGAVVLNEVQAPEYATLAWELPDLRPLVIHRLCVHPEWQSKGVGRELMDFAERFAAEKGHRAIRLDTYTGNPRAMDLYKRRGYRIAGFVRFPRRQLDFACFERESGLVRTGTGLENRGA